MINKLILSIMLLFFLGACTGQKKNVADLVSTDSVWEHLVKFDSIAKQHNSNRAVGTPGGIASKDYIIYVVKELGLKPELQNFTNHSGAAGTNIIVNIEGKSKADVLLLGAHYDSVIYGPGINDNATGVSILLELIQAIRKQGNAPEKTIRFAFWDSEETGVEGSPYFYKKLSETEKKQIKAYINLDMVASKDGKIQISDADGSSVDSVLTEFAKRDIDAVTLEGVKQFYGSIKFAPGSEKLELLAREAFGTLHVPVGEDLSFALNSDTSPFLHEIPTIGITVIKETTAKNIDGNDVLSFAPCYHEACDDISNVDRGILESCLKAMAAMLDKLNVHTN